MQGKTLCDPPVFHRIPFILCVSLCLSEYSCLCERMWTVLWRSDFSLRVRWDLCYFCVCSLSVFLSFFSPPCPSINETFSHPKWKKTGEKKITLPVHNSSWKSQWRERASKRGGEGSERESLCHLFTGMAMSNCVSVINEWGFCGGVRNLPWIRGPSKWMVYFFCLLTPTLCLVNTHLNFHSDSWVHGCSSQQPKISFRI